MKNEWGREIDPEREAAVRKALHIITIDARNDRLPDLFAAVIRQMATVDKDYKPCGLPRTEDL